jgi:DNA repair photolyase
MYAAEDFERRIVVKVNAAEKLRRELADPRWSGDHIAMGTNTDPYQPAEGRYRLTRGIVEALVEAGNDFSILTKSPMIVRDVDLLASAGARCALSIGTLDEDVWRASEPGTPPPAQRIDAVRRLTEAGIRCSVLIAPVLPGLSDGRDSLAEVVARSVEAGAAAVTPIHLHLRPGVREVFMPWLERYRPDLVPLYRSMYRGAYAPAAGARLAQLVDELYRSSRAPSRPHTERVRVVPAGSSRNRASRSASASSSAITDSAVESSSQIDMRTWRSSASPPR